MSKGPTRLKTAWFDRIKVLFILSIVLAFAVWQRAEPPFISFGEALSEFVQEPFGIVLLALIGLEILRQINYKVAEHWSRYHVFWQDKLFGGTEQALNNVAEYTRYRIRRLFKWGLLISIYAITAAVMLDEVETPAEAITQFPTVLGTVIPIVLQFAFFGSLVMFQFVAIFWFLSRGGIDIVFPQDIETRFDSVWGQDHVLDLVKENIAFLEKPDEIEAKGGYIPGGILLWGPPGTGKTLMAEGIAGEVGKPFVFVDPGAFIQMFFGVGILKVKRLFRKLRKLSLKHGGVVVFFDEADSLGNRGNLGGGGGQGPFQPYESQAAGLFQCNGLSFTTAATQQNILESYLDPATMAGDPDRPPRGLVQKIMMGAGMGGGGGMGTLQALLSEISGLTKPRGLGNRLRRLLGMKPKPPPKYRILIIMATNMPSALDDALLRPGRIDRIYKVGYPSKDGRLATLQGYLDKITHELTEDEVDRLAVMTPYYSGAKIKDLVNEAVIIAIRDDRETVGWEDIWQAKSLKELGPPEDAEYIVRERHAVAVHEASHAVTAHLLRTHMAIDLVTIERRGNVGGMVKNLQVEDRFTQWRTEIETDVKVFLASLAGEKMFFGGDNSSGVSSDLRSATQLVALMEGVFGMGDRVTSHLGIPQHQIAPSPDPTSNVITTIGGVIEQRLKELYDEVYHLLELNQEKVLALAGVLEERKTISGDDVTEVMGSSPGSFVAHEATGFAAVDPAAHEVGAGETAVSPDGEEMAGEDSGDTEMAPTGSASGDGEVAGDESGDTETAPTGTVSGEGDGASGDGQRGRLKVSDSATEIPSGDGQRRRSSKAKKKPQPTTD